VASEPAGLRQAQALTSVTLRRAHPGVLMTVVGRPLHVAHLGAGRHRALRQWRFATAERLQPLLQRADCALSRLRGSLNRYPFSLRNDTSPSSVPTITS